MRKNKRENSVKIYRGKIYSGIFIIVAFFGSIQHIYAGSFFTVQDFLSTYYTFFLSGKVVSPNADAIRLKYTNIA
jgi:hypothetical protein